MNGEARRKEILNYIQSSTGPVSGSRLSEEFHVSRQVIVQDVALLRAANQDIVSTNRGYVLNAWKRAQRIFKVCHADDEIVDELYTIVDMGGRVADVFVNHKVYGQLKADMLINSRRDVEEFMEGIRMGKSSPLKNITSGYHYHTVTADSEAILNLIENALKMKGYLVE
ncbi:transcription repressor NadR [Ruminococcus gauvreauii]|uniref:Transcription repressor NadR n=1 Tax=Ruminococcus gauvreauii TaxID=438033 RepID=A0ABY5VJJ0_9FIRM|nr:transcription repressor NadR [Ruminococcus gauvreauii]UWP60065.1 transcription repressor NadR [Ruminococcus gauvreauii]